MVYCLGVSATFEHQHPFEINRKHQRPYLQGCRTPDIWTILARAMSTAFLICPNFCTNKWMCCRKECMLLLSKNWVLPGSHGSSSYPGAERVVKFVLGELSPRPTYTWLSKLYTEAVKEGRKKHVPHVAGWPHPKVLPTNQRICQSSWSNRIIDCIRWPYIDMRN